MRTQNAITDFSNFKEDEIGDEATTILNELTLNAATFPGLPVAVATLGPQITDYLGILNGPVYDTRTADLKAARKIINTSLHDNGVYVNTVAKGDLSILGKSGYPLTDEANPVGELPAPVSLNIKPIGKGKFEADADIVPRATGYLFAFTPVSNTERDPYNWTVRFSKKHTKTFGDGVRGTEYKFAVCAVGAEDNVNWLVSGETFFAL